MPTFTVLWLADLNGTTAGVNGADYSLLHAAYDPLTSKPGNVADITGSTLGVPDNFVNGADYSLLHAEYNNSYSVL